MVVDLDDNEINLNHRKVLIPIGLAELDRDQDDVLMPNVSPQQLGELPDYDKNDLTADVERRICSTLERPGRSVSSVDTTRESSKKRSAEVRPSDEVDPEFYRHENYNLDNLYKNRLHEAQPARNKNETEYERSLRLWERRSEGGIMPGSDNTERGVPARDRDYYDDMDEETRQAIIRNRRDSYRQRRYGNDRSHTSE